MQKTFNAVDQTDLIIHANINKFVTRALSEIDGFADKTYAEQMQIMQQMVISLIDVVFCFLLLAKDKIVVLQEIN